MVSANAGPGGSSYLQHLDFAPTSGHLPSAHSQLCLAAYTGCYIMAVVEQWPVFCRRNQQESSTWNNCHYFIEGSTCNCCQVHMQKKTCLGTPCAHDILQVALRLPNAAEGSRIDGLHSMCVDIKHTCRISSKHWDQPAQQPLLYFMQLCREQSQTIVHLLSIQILVSKPRQVLTNLALQHAWAIAMAENQTWAVLSTWSAAWNFSVPKKVTCALPFNGLIVEAQEEKGWERDKHG